MGALQWLLESLAAIFGATATGSGPGSNPLPLLGSTWDPDG